MAFNMIRRDRRAPVMMLVHEECRITCDHRHSLWYLTDSLDCGLSRNAIRQWFVHDFVPMAAASRIEASASLSGEFRTLHSTTCCHTAECSPSIALAHVRVRLQASNVWAAPPGRVQPRPNVRTAPRMHTTAAKLRPESWPKPSRVWQGPLRVGWAESASPIRPDIPAACRGMRRPGGCLRGPLPNRGFELWLPER